MRPMVALLYVYEVLFQSILVNAHHLESSILEVVVLCVTVKARKKPLNFLLYLYINYVSINLCARMQAFSVQL